MAEEDRGLVTRVGPIEVDWPRSIGFFGALGLATAVGLIEPPLGVFIAAVPFIKMLNRPQLSLPPRFVSQVLDGMAKPVGGDAEGTIRYGGQQHRAKPQQGGTSGRDGTTPNRVPRGRSSADGQAGSRQRATQSRQRSAR